MSPVLDFMRGVCSSSDAGAELTDLTASTNPQTSHQALLLLAQLGPLVPDQLVHNVMPIFTFMGANVLQRDDAYSLRVVDRTLESIVPALVKSVKRSTTTRDALVTGECPCIVLKLRLTIRQISENYFESSPTLLPMFLDIDEPSQSPPSVGTKARLT